MSTVEVKTKTTIGIDEGCICPTYDFSFKKVFGRDGNEDILIDFVNSVMSEVKSFEKITKIYKLNSEQIKQCFNGKNTIVDIFFKDQLGRRFIVEMQRASLDSFFERAELYMSKCYEAQASPNTSYGSLNPVTLIAILNYPMPQKNEAYKEHYIGKEFVNNPYLDYHEMLSTKTYIRYFHKFRYCILSLADFPDDMKVEDFTIPADKWYYFFKHAKNREKMNALIEQNYEAINRAYAELLNVKRYSPDYYRLEQEIDDMKCLNDLIETNIKKGKAEGKIEERIKVIQNLLNCRVSIKTISEAVELPEKELREMIAEHGLKCKTKTGISM